MGATEGSVRMLRGGGGRSLYRGFLRGAGFLSAGLNIFRGL